MKRHMMNPLPLMLATSMFIALSGCGEAKTTIIEKDSIIEDEHEHEHEGEHDATAAGRLLILNPSDTSAQVYDLEDGDLLASLTLNAKPSAVYATGGYRYAALIERSADTVSFLDGGLWQEPHDDHFDLFSTAPSLSSFTLTGSRPTHFVPHDGEVALFLDGDSTSGNNAGVQVFSDHMIEEGETPITVALSMPMHGVAEPRGEHLFVSIRRDDSESTSHNTVLPDQVGVYHLHDDEYELEETFDITCPDLHGAAQNEHAIIFGCSDGVLVITDNGNDNFSAQKLANPDDLEEGIRIGSLWGHHDAEQFIAMASVHGGSTVQFLTIDPEEGEIELLDWQPMPDALPLARNFSFKAEQFLILDNQGYLTVIEPHEEDGHTHWEYGTRLDISEADVSTMPEGINFSMTFAQNDHVVYIADPIEQHIVTINLDLLEEAGHLELDYAPTNITWLGIASDDHEDHEH